MNESMSEQNRTEIIIAIHVNVVMQRDYKRHLEKTLRGWKKSKIPKYFKMTLTERVGYEYVSIVGSRLHL